jgi:hypothetical protein
MKAAGGNARDPGEPQTALVCVAVSSNMRVMSAPALWESRAMAIGSEPAPTQKAKAAFLRDAWGVLVPDWEVSTEFYWRLLPGPVVSRLPPTIRHADLLPLLRNSDVVESCFETAREQISATWDQLKPTAAVAILSSIEAHGLWTYFDPEVIKLSEFARQILRVRFDVADRVYESRDKLVAGKWLVTMRIGEPRNEPEVLANYAELVKDRSRIDLAFSTLAGVPESAALISYVGSRLKVTYSDKSRFLREVIGASSMFKYGRRIVDGNTTLSPRATAQVFHMISGRLKPFWESCDEYIGDPRRWWPSLEIIRECKAILQEVTMREKPEATHNWIINAPVGSISTGAYATIGPINQNLGKLRDKGEEEIGASISELTKQVIDKSNGLDDSHREELLEHLQTLSEMAVLPPEQRKRSVIRAVTTSLAGGLSTLGTLAEAWDKWGGPIRLFFGL